MDVEVYPLKGSGPQLFEGQVFGSAFLRSSRIDDAGMCFFTVWFRAFGLPIKAKRRYYGKKGASVGAGTVVGREYQFAGSAELDQGDIIRTYLFHWIVLPILVLVPMWALFMLADRSGSAWLLLLPLLWVVAVIVGVTKLGDIYFERYAPIHTPVFPPRRR